MIPTSILFICLGNICRSPLAEGVFRHQAELRGVSQHLTIASAATAGWHVGNPPDRRSVDIAERHGIDISGQICQRLQSADFHDFDLILAMDNANITEASALNLDKGSARLELFTRYGRTGTGEDEYPEIPDPYYGGPHGFETAYQMIKQASIGTLDRLFG